MGSLLKHPQNQQTRRIFVAATRMNHGKTTTCLGLYETLRARLGNIGFIKPVGQRFMKVKGLQVDEDSVLLDAIYDLHTPLEAMSPIAVDRNFSRRYLHNPTEEHPLLVDKICRAFDESSQTKDFTLIEGTGHAGVGSVFDLSNAQVANILQSNVLLVAEGGVGKTIDEISLNQALFDKYQIPIIGVILNKVRPDKLEMVTEFNRIALQRMGIPLLGVMPEEKILASPALDQVVEEIGGHWINGEAAAQHARIKRVVIGAMSAQSLLDNLGSGILVITAGDQEDILLTAIAKAELDGPDSIAGIILTRAIEPGSRILELLRKTKVPVAVTDKGSYLVTSLIHGMSVKTRPEDEDKIPVIQGMIQKYIDIDQLLESCAPRI